MHSLMGMLTCSLFDGADDDDDYLSFRSSEGIYLPSVVRELARSFVEEFFFRLSSSRPIVSLSKSNT